MTQYSEELKDSDLEKLSLQSCQSGRPLYIEAGKVIGADVLSSMQSQNQLQEQDESQLQAQPQDQEQLVFSEQQEESDYGYESEPAPLLERLQASRMTQLLRTKRKLI